MGDRLADRTGRHPDHRHPDDVPLPGVAPELRAPAPEPVDLDAVLHAHPGFGVTIVEIIDALGGRVSYRQVDYWLSAFGDVLLDRIPEQRANPGSGCPRYLSQDEAARLLRMGGLVIGGMRAGPAAQLARERDRHVDALALTEAWLTGRGECV